MNCKEFKEKVADLFDKTIDMQTERECKEHMAHCPACKAYYDELRETYALLQPEENSSLPLRSRVPLATPSALNIEH